jgi:hypothetical protein
MVLEKEISWAYDNVLIDVLCSVMLEKELPLGIVQFMWSLLWCKTLVFCVGSAECITLTGYRGLQQGSVLIPSQKHLQPPVSIRIHDRVLPKVVSFKYLGVDAGLR